MTSAFKAYDIRGEIPAQVNAPFTYRLGQAVAAQFTPQSVVVGHDMRLDSPALAQALIRQERFDWVIQKATELGVERIVPLMTAHTVIRPAKGQWPRKVVRWRLIAEEAAQQCGRSTVPAIDTPVPFARFVPSLVRRTGVVMPTLAVASTPLSRQLERWKGADAAIALIGPEGDFTRDEAVLAQRYGASLASLGQLTLRAETAAIVTLALLQHTMGTRSVSDTVASGI